MMISYEFVKLFKIENGAVRAILFRSKEYGRDKLPPPWDDLRFSNTTGILPKKKTMRFIGVEVEQGMSAPPPKKNPGAAPARDILFKKRHP